MVNEGQPVATEELAEFSPNMPTEPLSGRARLLDDEINACRDVLQLDSAAKSLWGYYGEGTVSEDDATYLASCIERRHPVGRRTAPGFASPLLGTLNGRIQTWFVLRQRPRPADRKASRDRRRMLGRSAVMPDNLLRLSDRQDRRARRRVPDIRRELWQHPIEEAGQHEKDVTPSR
jgi:hypothetical protein